MTTMDLPVRTPAERSPLPPAPSPSTRGPVLQRCVGNDDRERCGSGCGGEAGPVLQRSLGNGYLQRTAGCAGGCGGCALSRTVQPKLTISEAGGPDEQEADRIAEHVTGAAGGPVPDIQRLPGGDSGPAGGALPGGGGRPLPAATRAFMEPRFGTDFTGVRLHTGPDTDRFAAGIGARAFTHGHDIYLRQGESDQDHGLMAHELTHVVQQRGGSGALQRAITPELDRIEDLLSYGLFDWAITDAEAERALAILQTLPRFQQAAFFATVKYATRLRENLPDARVPELDALAAQVASVEPPAATITAVTDRLSYGLFDWAITDRDAVESLEMLKKLSGTQLAVALAAVDYDRLLDNLPDARRPELRELHDRALGHGGTRETEEAQQPGTRLRSITFHSDHGIMKDNNADWTSSGTPYGEPEWFTVRDQVISHPISQNRDTGLSVELGLDVLPANAPPAPVRVTGRSGEAALNFDFSGTLEGGTNRRLTMSSVGKLPDTIRALHDRQVVWAVEWRGWTHEIGRSAHTIFVTAANPFAPAEVTEKRMRKAVEITGTVAAQLGGIDPHEMVRRIMRFWGTYNLHVQYANAWELADNIETGAQCIDIVRFVQGLLQTVGVPGTTKAVVVWARPENPLVPVESAWLEGGMSLAGPHPAHPTWHAGLIDANGCPNNFEAALRFDYGGVRRYYPGGVSMNPTYATPEDVLKVFQCLAWLTPIAEREWEIQSIAATYPGGHCSPGRIRCK
ncbi:DUF4157 domain-containing protein [Amycolatopsis sp. NPDC051128]|uniref:eCIS core domain-containing protein n=1 Tax=Amycolatopsis sp. NPDC051128 TaxID=3155412 RepID=UPI00342C3BAB